MTFSRVASFVALMLPAVLVGQESAPAPTAAQLKARAEAAKQRAAQQPAAKTAAPTSTTAPQTKAVTPPETKTATAPQTKAAAPASANLTKTSTPTTPTQSKAAATTTTAQSKAATPTAAPQTKAATPAATPQTKAAAPAPQTAAPPVVTQQPVPPKPRDEVTFQREVFQYSAANRRDPFVSMVTSSDLRPQIIDLRLVTVISTQGGGGSVAILRDLVTKEQYRVRVGQTLGRMRVAQIQPRAVVFAIEEFGYNRQEVLTMNDSTKARTP